MGNDDIDHDGSTGVHGEGIVVDVDVANEGDVAAAASTSSSSTVRFSLVREYLQALPLPPKFLLPFPLSSQRQKRKL